MKYCLLTLALGFLFGTRVVAQPVPSPEADSLFTRMMSKINPRHVQWVRTTATQANRQNLGLDSILALSARHFATPGANNSSDIEAIAFLVLMQATKESQEDLKAIMDKVKAINESKQKLRTAESSLKNSQAAVSRAQLDSFRLLLTKTPAVKPKPAAANRMTPVTRQEINDMAGKISQELKSLNEMNEMEALRLQMVMDRQSKTISIVSNLLKKVSQTADTVIQNLK